MKRLAALLILIAGAAKADPLYLPVSADFEVRAYQYAVESSAWNTPTIRLYPFQGSTPINPATYSWVYRFGESEYTTSMVTIAGSAGSNYVDFAITGADFSQPCYRWYSAFRAVSGTTVVTFARGYLTIENSPEVTAASYIIRTSPTGTTTWVESIVSTDGSVVNRGDSVDQDLSVSNFVAQKVNAGSTQHYSKAQSDALYAPAGRVEEVAMLASTSGYTKAQSDARFATTGRVEEVAALVGGGTTSSYTKAESDARYATTNGLAVLSLKVDTATNNLATVLSWGNHATNGYAVQGGNITGRWVASGAGININDGAFVGGGSDVYALGSFSFVGGGFENEATGAYSTVVGGGYHRASTAFSFVGGGSGNRVYGNYGSILGGSGNTIYGGNNAAIGGGALNVAEGDYSAIPGGLNNEVTIYSFAAGVGAKATNSGSFVWSGPGTTNGTFGSYGDSTFNVRAVGGAYFLLPSMAMMDTNGFQWASLTPTGGLRVGINSGHIEPSGDFYQDTTNSALMGDIYAGAYKRRSDSNSVLWSGEAPTVAQYTAVLARVAYLESTLTAQVASLIAQIPALSNYVVASDSTITGLVASSSVSWTSTTASLSSTNAWLFTQVTNRDHTVTTGLSATVAANLATFSTFTNEYAAFATNVNAKTFDGTIKSGFMLAADWEDIRTNVAFAFSGTVAATNSAGTKNYIIYSDTNTWLHDGISYKWWPRYGF